MSEDGTYLRAAILANCTEEGECLLWNGSLASGYSPVKRIDGKNYSIRRWLWEYMGKTIPKGRAIKVKCRDRRCIAEAHLVLGYTGRDVGDGHRASTKAKLAEIKRAQSTLTMADAEEIRTSSESTRDLAARFDKSMKTIQSIRSGVTWRPLVTSMFAGLGAR